MKMKNFGVTKRVAAGLLSALLCCAMPMTQQAQIVIGLGGGLVLGVGAGISLVGATTLTGATTVAGASTVAAGSTLAAGTVLAGGSMVGGSYIAATTVLVASTTVAGASTVAVAAMGGTLAALLDYRTGPGSDLSVVRMLVDAQTLAFTLIGFPAAVLLAGGGISTLRNGGLPRWLGWLALLAAVLSVVGAAAQAATGTFGNDDVFSAIGFISFIALLVWVLLSSVLLLNSGFRSGEAAAPAAPA